MLFIFLIQADWKGNLAELGGDLVTSTTTFQSCTSTLTKDQLTSASGALHPHLIPFFRERSSSDSVTMGNKNSGTSKASRAHNKFHQLSSRSSANGGSAPSILPRSASRILVQTPEAVNIKRSETTGSDHALIGISDHSTNRNIHEITKSTTIDSIYVDANGEFIDDIDDPSSYKDVRAHHLHSWKCNDNSPLISPSENPIQEGAPFNSSSGNFESGGTPSSRFNYVNFI